MLFKGKPNNFKPLQNRTDTGPLWENFVITERLKFLRYQGQDANHYFWRTTQQQEIDLVEDAEDHMTAYEIKWNPKERVRFAHTFTENYPSAATATISPENVENFLINNPAT